MLLMERDEKKRRQICDSRHRYVHRITRRSYALSVYHIVTVFLISQSTTIIAPCKTFFNTFKKIPIKIPGIFHFGRVGDLRLLLNIELYRLVEIMRYCGAVLFSLLYALGKKILYLTVQRAEIILCPRGYSCVELRRKAKRNLLLCIICHINKGFRSLR